MKIFSVYSRIEPWHKIPIWVFILGLLGHAAFYEDKTYYGVCPYADQHGNLSFIVRVRVIWALCKACGICRILLKSIISDGRNLLLFTLNYTVTLPGLAIFSYNAILWYGSPASSNNQPLQSLPNNNTIETTTPPRVVYIIVTIRSWLTWYDYLQMRLHHCIEMCVVGQTYLLTTRGPKITQIQQSP